MLTSCTSMIADLVDEHCKLATDNGWGLTASFSGSFFGEPQAEWKLFQCKHVRRLLAIGSGRNFLGPIYRMIGCGVNGDKIYHLTKTEFLAMAKEPFRSEWI